MNTTAQEAEAPVLPRLGPLREVECRNLTVSYVEDGPPDGPVVFLLHGFPYDIHSYVDVLPQLVDAGCRVIVPYLRGHGSTRYSHAAAPRSGEQAALGTDLIDLMDALHVERGVFAGYDWGARAGCVAAALWPARCRGLVSVGSYLVQDLTAAGTPGTPELEAGFWYFWYFATARGAAGLHANARGIAEVIWRRNSPSWSFDDLMLDRAAEAFDNPDYVETVIHSYRHRLGLAPGHPEYAGVQELLRPLPPISVPTVTIDGLSDGNFPATDGTASAGHFTGPRVHLRVAGAGHNLPQEAPKAFAGAVLQVLALAERHSPDNRPPVEMRG